MNREGGNMNTKWLGIGIIAIKILMIVLVMYSWVFLL